MKLISRTIALLALLLSANAIADPIYTHFREAPVALTEADLHLFEDAFHINLHFTEAQKAGALAGLQAKIGEAQGQAGQIGQLITQTQALIQFVKEARTATANPSTMLQKGLASFFGRMLADSGAASAAELVASLETKVAEAKANQNTVTSALESASKVLLAVQQVQNLLTSTNSTSPLDKVRTFFSFASAHLDHLAEQPAAFGRRRLSLFQQRQRKERLLRTSGALQRAARSLASEHNSESALRELEHHLYDLVEDEGTVGKTYLRAVDTLKCILLGQCSEQVIFSEATAPHVDTAVTTTTVVEENTQTTKKSDTDAIVQSDNSAQKQSSEEQSVVYYGDHPAAYFGFGRDALTAVKSAFRLSGQDIIVEHESENDYLPSISDLPDNPEGALVYKADEERRRRIVRNQTAEFTMS